MILFKTTNAEVYEFVPEDSTFLSYKFIDIMDDLDTIRSREVLYTYPPYDPNGSTAPRMIYESNPVNPVEEVITSHIVSFWEQPDT